MSTNADFDRVSEAWLADGPNELSDRVLDAALREVHLTRQRRRLTPWRTSTMSFLPNSLAVRAIAAVMVAAVGIGGAVYFLTPRSGVGGPAPTASASPAPSPTAVAVLPSDDGGMPLNTATWTRFTTSRYGYTVAWPNTPVWIHQPAAEDWAGQTSAEMWASTTDAPWVDKFYDRATQVTLTAVAVTIPAGTTEVVFINTYLAPPAGPKATCAALAAQNMTPIVIDGHPARLSTTCGDQSLALTAFVAVGNRMFVFSQSDARQPEFFSAYLSTIRLPGPAPSAS